MSIIPGIEIAAPERTETSSGSCASPKRLPVFSSRRASAVGDLLLEALGELLAGGLVGAARVGRDREAAGDGDAELRHLREAAALASEEGAPALAGLVEVVDVRSSRRIFPHAQEVNVGGIARLASVVVRRPVGRGHRCCRRVADPTMSSMFVTVDGNEAAAFVAHRASEVIAIYPITPASAMGELADAWSAAGTPEPLGRGAPGDRDAERGRRGRRRARRAPGRRADDDLHRVAGPAPDAARHVQDRRRADLRGDPRRRPHARDARALDLRRPQRRDGRARRPASRCSAPRRCRRRRTSPRSPRGDARGARAVPPLLRRLPHLARGREDRAARRGRPARADRRRARRGPPPARALAPTARAARHRRRTPTSSSRPARPATRSTSRCPAIVQRGDGPLRGAAPAARYRLFDYVGASRRRARGRADGLGRRRRRRRRSSADRHGEKVGVVTVRLFRPFDAAALLRGAARERRARSPCSTARKEPGALGEPLYQDVVTALAEQGARRPRVIGGRYGLSSKEFTPAMAAAVFAELEARDAAATTSRSASSTTSPT